MGLMDFFSKVADSVEADVKAVTMYGKIAVAGIHNELGNEAEARRMINEVQNDGGVKIVEQAQESQKAVVQEGMDMAVGAVNAGTGLMNHVTKPLGLEAPELKSRKL